jgi:hypothetical protein
MADSDYDRDDRDDRPRRRDRDDDYDRPKKKGGCSPVVIVLGLLGLVGLLCAGGCGGFMWWSVSLVKGGQTAAEGPLTKLGSGDTAGAYNSMSAAYKATHTQAQFEKAMRDAKLTEFDGVTWDDENIVTQQDVMTFVGTARLKSGGTTPVTVKVRMHQDFKTYDIEDIGGTTFVTPAPGDVKKAP